MTKLNISLKIAVPKKQKITSKPFITIEAKNKKGCVFINENREYRVSIVSENDKVYNNMILPFTKESFDLKGRVNIFSKTKDEHNRYVRYVRNSEQAKYFPGDPNVYVPFAPNWIVTGNIVKENLVLKFDFISLVTIKGYNVMIHGDE